MKTLATDLPLCQLPDRLVRLKPDRIAQCAYNAILHAINIFDIELVRPVVQLEQVVHVIRTNAQTALVRVRIAHSHEAPGLEVFKFPALLGSHVSTSEEPGLGGCGNFVSMGVGTDGIPTVRDEVGKIESVGLDARHYRRAVWREERDREMEMRIGLKLLCRYPLNVDNIAKNTQRLSKFRELRFIFSTDLLACLPSNIHATRKSTGIGVRTISQLCEMVEMSDWTR